MAKRLIFEVCANCGKKILDEEKAVLIDEHNDLIFCDDGCVREYFEAEVETLEKEAAVFRQKTDIPANDFSQYENYLQAVLGEPDEIWDAEIDDEAAPLSFYIGEFFHDAETIFYIAAVYRVEEHPAFVYLHFPTRDVDLVDKYRRGELAFDGTEEFDEEDEITEGNIAIEMYNDMLDHRSEADIDPEDFSAFADFKLQTVEKPEEIWRRIDDAGNTFLIYVAHFQREAESLAYVVVAIEDDLTDSAVPVFGFPTIDQKLLDRFRTGEVVFKATNEF